MFVGHAKSLNTKQEVENFKSTIKLEEKNATHIILAYRIEISDGNTAEGSLKCLKYIAMYILFI